MLLLQHEVVGNNKEKIQESVMSHTNTRMVPQQMFKTFLRL